MNTEDFEQKKQELKELLKIEEKERQVQEIQKRMADPNFWRERQKAAEESQFLNQLQQIIQAWQSATTDEDLVKLETQAFLSGHNDENNAILAIHAGTGGTDAQDWAAMLLRMYERYAEKHNFQVKELDKSLGEEAGIKSVVLQIIGPTAYGYLRSEAGVHRLVRQSPFNADKLRQTSFALVEVIPEVKESLEIEIDPKDLRVDVYRSRGHGGQGVNTTDSAVRITHIPTGIVVTCQNERSQIQNRQTAMKILHSRLFALKLKELQNESAELKGEHKEAAWGNQIRSYVLHPYKQVKDHRTGYETTDTQAVLNGELDRFVEAYLKMQK